MDINKTNNKLSSYETDGNLFTIINDEMTWPSVNATMHDLAGKLHHNTKGLTSHEILVISSVMSSYMYMVEVMTQKDRNAVCVAIKNPQKKKRI